MTTETQPAIPGLEPPTPAAGALERAVYAHFAAAGEEPTLLERVRLEMCLDLARVMQVKKTSGRTSMYANDSKLLAELLGLIGDGADAGAGVDADLRRAIDAWTDLEQSRRAS